MLVIYITWYERNNDFSPNYNKDHHGTITGKDADDVMFKYRQFSNNHDLAKYTSTKIVNISD